jgi:hypothetical protein
LDIDVCTKGDGSLPSTVADKEGCLDAYDALIAGLPDTTARKMSNKTFLSTPQTLYASFADKCLKSICQKTTCYKAIIKVPVSTYDAALKAKLKDNCNLHSSGGDDNGNDNDLSMFGSSKLLISIGLLLVNMGFWL